MLKFVCDGLEQLKGWNGTGLLATIRQIFFEKKKRNFDVQRIIAKLIKRLVN